MGTNYYLHEKVCAHCGAGPEPKHIGKSSAGWYFALHVIPEENINSLDDWIARWSKPDAVIRSSGEKVSPAEMLKIITQRGRPDSPDLRRPHDAWYQSNDALPGINNLARSKLFGHCIGYGEGTWELYIGEFC
jgi:hypothetical protein